MNDTERIFEIMKQKHLNNVQFCALTGIANASLSHFSTGRNKPTLATLRSIVKAFPDLSTEWVMMGEGPMYRDAASAPVSTPALTQEPESVQQDSLFSQEENEVQEIYDKSFLFSNAPSPATPKRTVQQKPMFTEQPAVSTPPHQVIPAEAVEGIVRETISQMNRPHHRIIEVRIFFDDGTYESFGGPS